VAVITAAVGTLVAQDHGYTPADMENGFCDGHYVAIAAGSVLFVDALR
jgi:hypothetical protein